MANRNPLTRAQFLLSYLLLTAAIATGLALFSSATTVINLIHTATADILLPLLLSLIVAFLFEPLVSFIEREQISRTCSIFIVYLLVSGSLLLGWLEDVARTAGIQRIHVECRRDNPGARNFYGEHGYHEFVISKGYYGGVEDAIRLEKRLGND